MTGLFRMYLDQWRSQLAGTLGTWLTSRRTIHGIPVTVINTRSDISTVKVLERLEGALDLIATYQPWRFRRLQHDFARILVQRYPCRAAYMPQSRTCVVELTFLVNPEFNLAQLASSIVHEGTHARLDRVGVHVPEDQRYREERLCRKSEVEFGRAVPDGEAVVARALEALRLSNEDVAPVIDWREAQRRIEQADRNAQSSS
ncbi:MAG: hypothetical protein ACRENC_08645 [Gemmatimonadaceae bacterium]